ncbi:hypothetical protein [Streptomyces litchfieldiae]|uniref:Uncharacterized protein n=1 Tax=Streptomyces litchfieldiae TaxID=3075543 RepID=A0ABU2MKC9_9ACTN|nr:hypothetical protein [Streptomyces sp. DSM 44938]MDT0342067.1 hypothetical protein [Streptomyces sp. DSM 44938]
MPPPSPPPELAADEVALGECSWSGVAVWDKPGGGSVIGFCEPFTPLKVSGRTGRFLKIETLEGEPLTGYALCAVIRVDPPENGSGKL